MNLGCALTCKRGCNSCCVDEITVFEVEAENIKKSNKTLLANETSHPKGMCAFLDNNGSCRIYDNRPYVCRTQGLPLRWIDEASDEHLVEMRDICPLNDEKIQIEELEEEKCWTIGQVEAELAALQSKNYGEKLRRVSLRSLFNI